jgi:CheY-like chemotaxis protein
MKTVLIAEDDELIRKSYVRMFRGMDVELKLCKDAVEALRLIDEGLQPACIISDLEMPDMLGSSFCMYVRQRKLETPFILVSGGIGLQALAETCGATDWSWKGDSEHVFKLREFVKRHAA